jgi:hypothetical protein
MCAVFTRWGRCKELGDDGSLTCRRMVNFACDGCDGRVCVFHVRIGLPPERRELCPACYARERRAPTAPAAPPLPWWLRWLARLLTSRR